MRVGVGRAYGPTMHSLNHLTTTSTAFGEPRIVERHRGSAHPASMSTRERVARSLLIHPSPVASQRPLPLR